MKRYHACDSLLFGLSLLRGKRTESSGTVMLHISGICEERLQPWCKCWMGPQLWMYCPDSRTNMWSISDLFFKSWDWYVKVSMCGTAIKPFLSRKFVSSLLWVLFLLKSEFQSPMNKYSSCSTLSNIYSRSMMTSMYSSEIWFDCLSHDI